MFFRTKTTPSGTVLQLIESFRNSEGQPRQRLVVSLGDAAIDEADRPMVAKAVQLRLRGVGELVEVELAESVRRWTEIIVRRIRAATPASSLPAKASAAAPTVAGSVVVDQVTHEDTALLGGVLIGHDAWKKLGMDDCLESLGLNPSQRLAAAVHVVNRLVDPVSDNALCDWVLDTALPELLGRQVLEIQRDRFYRVSDRLVSMHHEIEAHLRQRQKQLFGLDRTLVLYDLTNTYFEGEATANPKARRGKSKEKRDDCPQLVVGVVFDEYGFELAHEVFEGGTSDSKTLETMVERLRKSVGQKEDLLGTIQPLVILDGGIATKANCKFLRAQGWRYLVNQTRTGRGKWAEQFADDSSFQLIEGRDGKSPVRVHLVEQDVDGVKEHVILCKSEGRREKELAIRSRTEEKLVEKLEALGKRVASGKLKDAAGIQRCIGRILSQHPRAARFYDVKLESSSTPKLVWALRGQLHEKHDQLLGCYVLRCFGAPTPDPRQLWEVYMTLCKAEDGFRCLKSDLGLRPVRHHKESRADGHIFISILAYHLLRQILYRLDQAGDHRSWDTLRRVACTHVYATIVIPTLHEGTHRIRRPGKSDSIQQELYSRLGIDWTNLPVTREHLPPQPRPIL
jgi:transposase